MESSNVYFFPGSESLWNEKPDPQNHKIFPMKHFIFQSTLLVTLVFCIPFIAIGEDEPADPGQITFRSQVSTMDFEEIDPYSGTLALTHKDVSLPGNGGLDLEVFRTYRSDRKGEYTVLGYQWNTHFGRINPNGMHISIELQDGTVSSAVNEIGSGFNHTFLTKDFWKVIMPATWPSQQKPILQLTDGD